MRPIDATVAFLRREISTCESRLKQLKHELAAAEARAHDGPQPSDSNDPDSHHLATAINGGFPEEWQDETMAALAPSPRSNKRRKEWPLAADEYKRYGRQLIMPEVGLTGQLNLKKAKVLVVGAGGLGCPAAAYLAGAGVGVLGLVDGDEVESSNLHRQILHSEGRVGMKKVDSAIVYLSSLNPNVGYNAHPTRLDPSNALGIFSSYDLVLDCTDTPASRYLISDTCVLLSKPLVSASALRTEGQLIVLNNPPLPPGNPNGGPCYRCVFPKPPPVESVVSCGDGGILGPVVGVMGVLQALEAIKLIAAGGLEKESMMGTSNGAAPYVAPAPTLLIFSAYASPQFRTIRLRSRKPKCAACGPEATVTRQALQSDSMDYVQFCGSAAPVEALSAEERMGVEEYSQLRDRDNHASNVFGDGDVGAKKAKHVLVDVREKVQFDLCHLEGSVNIPFSDIAASRFNADGVAEPAWVRQVRDLGERDVVVACRLGNDSQVAVRKMKEVGLDEGGKRRIVDVRGGLRAWRERVDGEFPEY
ncbi:hypothetical protein K490DRAFT_71480 [Saccharata proteae CBS 121410]|uniref:Adenylyltransferase and sulfurtransferase uba4 n=1 Tax=Saccharata proteae CBS 121410 TaxID=1314787 RepID=A0A9P4I3N6_9PEZI|nr:hypothetical protein K490DRAFT_71480 [Saccharata proteae CBS 121410]